MDTALTTTDFFAISPLVIVLLGALFLLVLETISPVWGKAYAFPVTLCTIVISASACLNAPYSTNPLLTPWVRFDAETKGFTLLFLAIGAATTLLSASFFKKRSLSSTEHFFLLLSSLFGLILIGSAADFLTFFVGLETLSIALYVLCGYMKRWSISQEGSIKYFLIGSLGAALLLYGIALVYGALGTTRFAPLLEGYHGLSSYPEKVLFLCGIAFITLGLGLKAAIVPFHTWAPDVYQGASNPVTAFMATGTKAGAFVAFAVIFLKNLYQFDPLWNSAIALLAYPTLIYANMVAFKQTQLRRFFAYSGISHAGFLLIPLAAGTSEAFPALFFYLVVYVVATFGCFALIALFDRDAEGATLDSLRGLFYRAPFIAGFFTLALLTLAGIPPTVGFFAKFTLFKVALDANLYGLVIVGLLTTILSAYYYLKIVAVMLKEPALHPAPLEKCPYLTLLTAASFIGILLFSLSPSSLIEKDAFFTPIRYIINYTP